MKNNYQFVGVEKTPEQLEFYKLKDSLNTLEQLDKLPHSERKELIRRSILKYLNPTKEEASALVQDLEQIKSEIDQLSMQRQEILSEIDKLECIKHNEEALSYQLSAFADFCRMAYPRDFKRMANHFLKITGYSLLCD